MNLMLLGFERVFGRTATEPATCDACGGPIATGDSILTAVPFATQPAVQHRSCAFMPRDQVRAFRNRPTRRQSTLETPPEQTELPLGKGRA